MGFSPSLPAGNEEALVDLVLADDREDELDCQSHDVRRGDDEDGVGAELGDPKQRARCQRNDHQRHEALDVDPVAYMRRGLGLLRLPEEEVVLRPQEGQIVWDEAVMLEQVMGSFGHYLFLVIGMAALYSSQMLGVDGGARTWTYIVRTNFKFGAKKSPRQWYVIFAITIMSFGVAATYVLEALDITALGFIFNSALIGGFAMAVYVPLLLVINVKYLPKSARPKWINLIMTSFAASVYISFALYTLWGVFN